jgi:hypothetical protein
VDNLKSMLNEFAFRCQCYKQLSWAWKPGEKNYFELNEECTNGYV